LQIFGPTLFDEAGKPFETARWHAPEVLKYSNHTFKSNVWSFGVLMWEICTLGATPYGNNIPTIDLFARIRNGARPEQSPFIFDDLYQLFLNCWELDAKERPTFTEITNYLKTLTTSINHVLSFDRRDGIILPYHLPLLEIKN
jgi:endothelial-specific receptor tyrosine kinase